MYYYGYIIAYNHFSSNKKQVEHFPFPYDREMNMFYDVLKLDLEDEKKIEISYKMKILFDKLVINDLLS